MNPDIPRRTALTAGAALAAAAIGWNVRPTAEAVAATAPADHCFTKADNERLGGLRVFQIALPPANDTIDATYAFWPCTDTMTSGNFSASTWSGDKWHLFWSNRSNTGWNWKPNSIAPIIRKSDGIECRAAYSSVAKANAVTLSQIRYSLGVVDYAAPWVAAGGSASDFVPRDDLAANPNAYFTNSVTNAGITYWYMTDIPWIPTFRLHDVQDPTPGIALDYEVTDSRAPAESAAFLRSVANTVHAHGKQLVVLTNPLNSGSANHNGLNETNLPDLHQNYFDYLEILLWSGNPEGDILTSYNNQLDVLRGTSGTEPIQLSKILIAFELGNPGTTLADAQTTHDILTDTSGPHPTVVTLVRNGVALGGPCGSTTNDKVSIVCFGTT